MDIIPSSLTDNDLKVLNDFSGYIGFRKSQVFEWVLRCPCKIICLFTGNQFGKGECLSYVTLIDTPQGRIPIGELYEKRESFDVYSWDGRKKVVSKALPPFKKEGLHKMYRITMSDGQWIEASGGHRILMPLGDYASVGTLYDSFHGFPRKRVYGNCYRPVSSLVHKVTNGGFSQLVHVLSGRSWFERLSSFLYYCLGCFRLCGGRLLSAINTGASFVPLLNDVLRHDLVVSRKDDLDCKYTSIQKLKHALLSTLYAYCRNVGQFFESLNQAFCTNFQPLLCGHQELQQHFFELNRPLQSSSLNGNPVLSSLPLAYDPPVCFNGNHIISIESIASQEVYDFEVEKYHNYLAGDMVHHNTVIMDYYYRLLGKHPIARKNIGRLDKIRTFRLASETLPGDSENEEVKNTLYPVLKRRFNPSWIVKDVTARKSVVVVQPRCGGKPVNFEFVSYGQSVQSTAGHQRRGLIIDEECSRDFFGEQVPRLLAGDGDVLVAFTPVPGEIGWMFDDLYERARYRYRTKAVRDRIKLRTGEDLPEVEETESTEDIAVIMAATDDNPIYVDLAKEKSERDGRVITAEEYIGDMFSMYADEDVIDARRYGIFRQLPGKIFKQFNSKVHVISGGKYFPDGMPYEWKHFRGIDWHETTPWAIGWVAVSPEDEIFVYNEFNPSPEKLITLEIARVIASRSGDYRFALNLIDPLSSKIQPNTGLSSLEDLNRIMAQYRKEGLGTGGHWAVWDTKSQKGRDEIRKRLANAAKVGVPFNNFVKEQGVSKRLPTIWFLDNCTQTILSMKNWRRGEWANRSNLQEKEEKETPQQRWSHFCTMLEGLMKRPEVFQARFASGGGGPVRPKHYFKAT